jgi:hypothetical protein
LRASTWQAEQPDVITAQMKRLFWFLVKLVLALVAVAVVALIALFIVLRPPEPLGVPAQGIKLSGVTVINPGIGRHAQQTVVVEGAGIKSVANSASADSGGPYAGMYVLPGLIDMHVHTPPPRSADYQYFFLMYLRYGVITIRDTGNDGWLLKARAQLLNGEMAGPRAFTCGPIIDGDPPIWPFSRVVRNAGEADKVVDDLANQGADFIKVYERLTPEALWEIEAEAHRRHLRVVGHVPELVRFEDAHIDDVQHLTGTTDVPRKIFLDFPEVVVAGAKGWHDMDDRRMAFVVKTSLDQHIAHTPTLVVLDRISRRDFDAQRNEPIVLLMPRWYREVSWQRSRVGFSREDLAALETFGSPLPKMKLLVRRMHEAGVTLHVGTDTINPFVVPGASLHEEMRNFLDCGFTPEQVWAAATRENGAALMKNLGVVKSGAPADLLVFKQDPTKDLSKLDDLEAVVTNGRLYTRADLENALARYRAKFSSPMYERVMTTLIRLVVPKPQTKVQKSS